MENLRLAEAAAQRVVVHEDAIDLVAERRRVAQILHADGAAADLVLVCRPDAAAGSADLAGAGGFLADDVELAVQRQNERGVLGDAQVVTADGNALPGELVDLLAQRPRIDDDAVADDAELAGADDARRQQRQLEGFVADDQRVPGVMTALEAHDDIGTLRQPIYDLAFALVAPLGADHRDVRHLKSHSQLGPGERPGPFGPL